MYTAEEALSWADLPNQCTLASPMMECCIARHQAQHRRDIVLLCRRQDHAVTEESSTWCTRHVERQGTQARLRDKVGMPDLSNGTQISCQDCPARPFTHRRS